MKYPYLDPKWIPLLREMVIRQPYEPNRSSELLARDMAYSAGREDIVTKLESIVKLQEKNNDIR